MPAIFTTPGAPSFSSGDSPSQSSAETFGLTNLVAAMTAVVETVAVVGTVAVAVMMAAAAAAAVAVMTAVVGTVAVAVGAAAPSMINFN